MIRFTPRPLYHRGNRSRYPLYRRLGGPQSQVERGDEEKILVPAGNRGRSPRNLVTILTELPRLLNTVKNNAVILLQATNETVEQVNTHETKQLNMT
jgi:hypothetical protein